MAILTPLLDSLTRRQRQSTTPRAPHTFSHCASLDYTPHRTVVGWQITLPRLMLLPGFSLLGSTPPYAGGTFTGELFLRGFSHPPTHSRGAIRRRKVLGNGPKIFTGPAQLPHSNYIRSQLSRLVVRPSISPRAALLRRISRKQHSSTPNKFHANSSTYGCSTRLTDWLTADDTV